MITIILFIFLMLFGGCRSLLGLGLLYTASPPPTPILLPTRAIIETTPTFTPTPFVTPSADTAPCTVTVRQPPINSPTQIPNNLGTPQVGVPLDFHVAYCMNLGTLVVGDTWELRVRGIGIGLPVYYLTINNDTDEELTIRYNPDVPSNFEFSSNLSSMTMVSATTYNEWEAIFTLTANAVDVVQISLYAHGEVGYGYPGPVTWSWAVTPTETFFLAINE